MDELTFWAEALLNIYGSMIFGIAAGLALGRVALEFFRDE